MLSHVLQYGNQFLLLCKMNAASSVETTFMLLLFFDHPSAINRLVVLFTKCKSYFTRTLKVKRSTSFLTFILVTRQF